MKKIIFALILVLSASSPAFADWELDLKNLSASLNVTASDRDGEAEVASALSIEFNMDKDLIIKKKEQTGLTYGDIAVALSIARQTNKDVNVVISDHKKYGRAWGKVAKAHCIRTDDLVHSVGKVHEKAKGKGRHKDKGAERGKGQGKGKKKE
ncbi:MAG: hypothetical protein HZB79_04420 [Deltaproteobacteria bacterium]|nr:hypothetical protein [Deltaproteobacteria bacterium]